MLTSNVPTEFLKGGHLLLLLLFYNFCKCKLSKGELNGLKRSIYMGSFPMYGLYVRLQFNPSNQVGQHGKPEKQIK